MKKCFVTFLLPFLLLAATSCKDEGDKLLAMQKQKDLVDADRKNMQNQLNDANKEIGQLRELLKNSKKSQTFCSGTKEQLAQELSDAKKQIDNLTISFAKANNKVVSLEKANRELQNEMVNLETSLGNANNKIVSLERDVKNANENTAAFRKAYEDCIGNN